jgi:hypothetical protein
MISVVGPVFDRFSEKAVLADGQLRTGVPERVEFCILHFGPQN